MIAVVHISFLATQIRVSLFPFSSCLSAPSYSQLSSLPSYPALLIYFPSQLGFFKRQYKTMLDKKAEDTATFSGEDVSCEAPDLPLS